MKNKVVRVSYAKTVYGQKEIAAVVKALNESTQMGPYTKKFEEKVEIVVDPEVKSVDLAKMVLPGEALTVEVSGEKTKATTGTKKIGDNAKGSVKIQNGTSSIINLTGGTVLLAANNLKYNLASSASISAALSPSNPGTQIIEVSAADIGAEYNLAKDESFKNQ